MLGFPATRSRSLLIPNPSAGRHNSVCKHTCVLVCTHTYTHFTPCALQMPWSFSRVISPNSPSPSHQGLCLICIFSGTSMTGKHTDAKGLNKPSYATLKASQSFPRPVPVNMSKGQACRALAWTFLALWLSRGHPKSKESKKLGSFEVICEHI